MLAYPVTPGMPAFPAVLASARNGAHFGLSDVIFAPAPLLEPDLARRCQWGWPPREHRGRTSTCPGARSTPRMVFGFEPCRSELASRCGLVVVSEVVVAGVLEPPLAGVAEVDGVAAGLTSPAPRSPAEPELEQPAMDRQAQTPTASSQNRFPEADRSIVITVSLRMYSSFWDAHPVEAGRSCPCLSGHAECADDDTMATFLANPGFVPWGARHDKPNVWPMAYERPAMSVERPLACGHRRRETQPLPMVPTEGALSAHSPSCRALAEQPARRSPLTRASRRGQTKHRRTSWTSSTHPRRSPTTDTGSVSAWTRAGLATVATSPIRCSTVGVTSTR